MEFMMNLNLFDSDFSYAPSYKEAALMCGLRNKKDYHLIFPPKNTRWTCREMVSDVPTVFTDVFLTNRNLVRSVSSPVKIAWLLESILVRPNLYKDIMSVEDEFDLIFTYNFDLLKRNPQKYKFFPADSVCIEEVAHGVNEKTKLTSMIYSSKGEGDRTIRHQIADMFYDKIDLFGSGSAGGLTDKKSDTLVDYCFSIAIENCICDGYYTEKILDCFITGNIPVYRGTDRIRDFVLEH